MLAIQSIITHTGTIVDATFVDVPKQRNTTEENKKIKEADSKIISDYAVMMLSFMATMKVSTFLMKATEWLTLIVRIQVPKYSKAFRCI